MRPLLHQPSTVEGEDAVGVAKGGEPVRDGDRRPAMHEHRECLLDRLLRFRVDVARGLVEHEHPRV